MKLNDAYTRADELSSERRYDEAIQILDEVLSGNPADVSTLHKKGALLHTAGRYPDAKAPLVEALTLDPQNIGALQTLAHVENALGEYERSLSLFRQIASLRAPDDELDRMIASLTWAVDEKRVNDLAGAGCHDEATEILDRVLWANPADVTARIKKGALLHTAGRPLDAKAALAEALYLDPRNIGALQTLAHVENALGEPERALSLFRQLASLKGSDDELARTIASLTWAVDEKRTNELANEGRYDEAIEILDRVFSANPAAVTALIKKGSLLHTAGRSAEARAPLGEALRLEPRNIGALQTLAHVENALGDPERSLSLFRQLASLKGPDDELDRTIANLTWAVDEKRTNELANEGRYDEAIEILDRVFSANPAAVTALIKQGSLLHTAGRSAEARAPLGEALRLEPRNIGALQTLAHVENALGDPERSLSLFRQLASLKGPDDELDRTIANLTWAVDEKRADDLADAGRHDEAVQILDRVLSANPAHVTALIKKGALFHTAGRYAEAKAALTEALSLDPQNHGALQTLAHVENASGEPGRSLSLFRQLASLKGPGEELARTIAHLTWAVDEKRVNELAGDGRYDEAIEVLDRVLSANPADVNALVKKGGILHTAGRYPEARTTLAQALAVEPQNVGALQSLAHVENASGEPERSLALFRQLASLRGLDEELACMIGSQIWALDERRRDSSTYKDVEEGCPPIEQIIAEIETGPIRNDPGNSRLQREAIERLSRQIAAQTSALGRLNAELHDIEYYLVLHRFRNMALQSYIGTRFKPPEEPAPEIPPTMRSAFSMDGRVELLQGYVNSTLPFECSEGIDDEAVRTFLALYYERLPPKAEPRAARIIEGFAPIEHSQTKKAFAIGGPMLLPEFDLRDKSIAVVASPDCYLDATLICLCGELTSVRLRRVGGSTELFRAAFLLDWLREDTQYDLIICPSLVEQWGLGRRGEPIDPDGDMALMRRFREKLRPAGSCYIQLPIGRDRLIFNAMRIYGRHRLAAILEGWRPKSADGVKADRLNARVPVRENFVLQPNGRSSRPLPSLARKLDEHPSGARVVSMDAPSAAGASLQPLMLKLRMKAQAQAEQIAMLRAQRDSMKMEFPALTLSIYQLNRQTFGPPSPCPTPPPEIPPHLLDAFTMGGIAKIESVYLDATYPSSWPLIYTDNEIDYYLKRIGQRKPYVYGMIDAWIWEAMEKYPIAGLSVVNMGSITPWYESICLYYGASSTTIDYNKIITLTDRIKTMTVADWDREQPTFDVAWSISSFEHDGLGMYGDPLDPDGDLKAMQKMKRIVKPGGLMFFAIPVDRQDKILWNLERLYGPVRLKKIFEGWEVLDSYGVHPPGAHVQPLFILRNI